MASYLVFPSGIIGIDPCWLVATPEVAGSVPEYYVIDDMGTLVPSSWDARFVHRGTQSLHEYDDEAWAQYWPESMRQPAPAVEPAPAPAPVIDQAPAEPAARVQPVDKRVAARERARVLAKLDAQLLQHLLEVVEEQAAEIEALKSELNASRSSLSTAQASADFWMEAHHELADQLDDGDAAGAPRCIGLTKDGALMVVRTGGAA